MIPSEISISRLLPVNLLLTKHSFSLISDQVGELEKLFICIFFVLFVVVVFMEDKKERWMVSIKKWEMGDTY